MVFWLNLLLNNIDSGLRQKCEMSGKAGKGTETPLVLDDFKPSLFRTILPTHAHSILAASQMIAHVWKQCARSGVSVDYSVILESSDRIGGGSGLSELVCGPNQFAGDARDVYCMLSSYSNALGMFNLRFSGHRGGLSFPDVRPERNPIRGCRSVVEYVKSSLPRFADVRRTVSRDVHDADRMERILSIIDLCGATLLRIESFMIPYYARHGVSVRNSYIEDYFYATHIGDHRVMHVASLNGASSSELVSLSNSLFPVDVTFDSVQDCREFFRQTIRFIINQRIGFGTRLDDYRAKLHSNEQYIVYMCVSASKEMLYKYNVMKERILSSVVDGLGRSISRNMFLDTSNERLEFRFHIGTVVKSANCDSIAVEEAVRFSNDGLRTSSAVACLKDFVLMKDEPLTECYRLFARVDECDGAVAHVLKVIGERSGCVVERPHDLLSCVANSHHVDVNGFPSGHSNVVAVDVSKLFGSGNRFEIGKFALREVVIGVMEKSSTGTGTERYGCCHRCLDVL